MSTIQTKLGTLYHPKRGKHWAKLVERLDPEGNGGFMFVGSWVARGQTVELPVGALVLLYDEDLSSKGRLRERSVGLHRVTPDGTELIHELVTADAGWALKIRDKVAEALNKPTADGEISVVLSA